VLESAELCASGVTKYWWPAGRLDPGENFEKAAVRETEEEGGVKIRVIGVLEIRINASRKRVDVILLAEPVPTEGEDDMAACKSVPDFESVGAMWVDVSELDHLKKEDFRNPDPLKMFPLVSNGKIWARSIENQAFRQLEELMTTWTVKKGECQRDLESVANSLCRKYGPDVVLVRGGRTKGREDLYSSEEDEEFKKMNSDE
jgi:ADP-ribose pyrophosphatase YjhB (NUDIX family)